ncbi:MAG: type II toxin-antitoxin system PemK/MazF family toxin [Treponema sp.]|jgi:mRNA interferase MazF|nr:type II toxin-antitoxin system PemK/MazF family toxin [Treponema sp.]
MMVKQYEIYWVKLDPTVGSEIQKTRPCVVITPNEMNNSIDTIIIAPLTTKSHNFPTRLRTTVEKKDCWIVLDQIRAIDKSRLNEKIGELDRKDVLKLKNIINEMLVE